MKMNSASQDRKFNDIGANIFIGNLTEEVDEKLLYDTFSAFGGMLTTPKVMRDPETGMSKGYGFISFDSFESSDMAIECMNGQYLCNRPIVIQYAFKKDTPGERHGSQAERLIAAANPAKFKPNTLFSAGSGDSIVQISAPSTTPLTSNTFALTGAYNAQAYMPPVLQHYNTNSQAQSMASYQPQHMPQIYGNHYQQQQISIPPMPMQMSNMQMSSMPPPPLPPGALYGLPPPLPPSYGSNLIMPPPLPSNLPPPPPPYYNNHSNNNHPPPLPY